MKKLEGTENVLFRMRRFRDKELPEGVERGLKLAGLHLLRESQNLVPVDYGQLKASGVVRTTGKGYGTVVTVAYTAPHALYVHENLEMKLKGQPRPGNRGYFWDPPGRGQSKFLETPARRDAELLKRLIRDSARIGVKKTAGTGNTIRRRDKLGRFI